MRDLTPGRPFPNLRLPDHLSSERSLAEIADKQPLIVCFLRGWWCPKEQVRVRNLVAAQEELQCEYGKLCAITVDEPKVNGAARAGLGARFPFLSDQRRRIGEELGLLELTDENRRPFLPLTFVLDSRLRVHRAWCGFWYSGNPTIEELRLALREIARAEQPSFDPFHAWSQGAVPAARGISADVVAIREDSAGREISRTIYEGKVPDIGAQVGRPSVDGRPWLVHSVECREHTLIRLRRPPSDPDDAVGER